jgi:hypothetical protein
MALNNDRVRETAVAIRAMAERATVLLRDIEYLLRYNSNQSIEWNAAQKPDYIDEEETGAGAGNLNGLPFTRANVSNAIFSLSQIQLALTNQATSQGDHIGNLNVLSSPKV